MKKTIAKTIESIRKKESLTSTRELNIPAGTKFSLNNEGYKVTFFDETAELIIGIGKDHVAFLVMDKEAFEAFAAGENITVR